jgi:hypothetical protein
MTNRTNRKLVAAVGGVLALAATGANAAGEIFDWADNGAPSFPNTTPSIFLRDDNLAAVDAFLANQSIRAVKIDLAVSPATISAIYNKYKIDYTFADFETPDALTRTKTLVAQIKASTATGAAFAANQAFVSNFNLTPTYNDATGPSTVNSYTTYTDSGVNMASDVLYPGSFFYRSPAGGNSTAPNIRSSLFTLPIEKLSLSTAVLPTGHAHVAWVNRFNNYGNLELDSDHDASNGYQFVTTDQLLSRGDFKAQVLHYRLRGATGVHGLDGGVVNYTRAQFQSDINDGWNGLAPVNQVFADPKARLATLDTSIKVDGASKTPEETGVIFSGAYSMSLGKMVMLISNLDEKGHAITLPDRVGGKPVTGTYNVDGGSHELLEFGLTGTTWNLISTSPVFTDADRSGTGVPEPTTLALVGAAASLVCVTRRRRAK